MDILNNQALVSAIISLALVVITALLRDKLGVPQAENILKLRQAEVTRMSTILQAATYAVTEVEHGLKQNPSMTNDQLKVAAIQRTKEILLAMGVYVPDDLIASLGSFAE